MSRDDLRTDGGISITAEEFERLKQANSSTPPEERQRCPECGGADPVRKSNRGNQTQKPGQYRCRRPGCYAHFDEPVTGYESAEAVVEEREENRELVTDGGQDAEELATRLIELRDEFEEIGEHVDALGIRDAPMLVDILDDQAEVCLRLAQAIEIRKEFDPQDHKIGDDQVLTDGGGIPCPDCGESKPKYGDCRHCGYQPYTTDGGTSTSVSYRINGHEFEVVLEHEGSVNVQCRECLLREHIADHRDDPEDFLELMTPECHIEWLRQADGGFRGIALRNASGFRGRQLIAVDSDGEVTDKIRVYDDDHHHLASLLDKREWDRRVDPEIRTDGGVEYRNAEDLSAGQTCPQDRCGGYLEHSAFVEGLVCSNCEQEWRGR